LTRTAQGTPTKLEDDRPRGDASQQPSETVHFSSRPYRRAVLDRVFLISTAENKRLMQQIFRELSRGNSEPFRDAMADDFCWTIIGTTTWSGTYAGKQAVLSDLMGPLFSQFADRYTNTADRFIAGGEHVVIQCRGHVTTKSGMPYNNNYCYVCRLADGKLRELTEYCDTQLIATALAPPGVSG
jgi:uncharacterized protein